jgi:cellulose synthase/poly-beta-1,6-N-acetylglucosamine synthase-like glycosyltransferase
VIAFSFFTIFAALSAVYMLFLFRLHSGLRFLMTREPSEPRDDDGLMVTVLVPIRNEAQVLPQCLASLSAQDYSREHLEILLVDDHSDDGSAAVMKNVAAGDTSVRMLTLPDGKAGKKDALSLGVAEARGEVIVTTDADCRHDPGWLRSLLHPFHGGADVVAAPVVFDDRQGMFARLQALEFLGLMGVGAGFFGIGFPRLCNGANFAYRRRLFEETGGYEGNRDIHSGDDEFLLYNIVYRHGGRAEFVTDAAAIVRTVSAPTLRLFLRQRIRWASKARHHEDGRFAAFLMILFAYFLFACAAPAAALSSTAALLAGIVFFLVKTVTDARVLFASASLFRQPIRLIDIFVGELFHAYYIVIVSCIGFFGAFSWKNRNVKNV